MLISGPEIIKCWKIIIFYPPCLFLYNIFPSRFRRDGNIKLILFYINTLSHMYFTGCQFFTSGISNNHIINTPVRILQIYRY